MTRGRDGGRHLRSSDSINSAYRTRRGLLDAWVITRAHIHNASARIFRLEMSDRFSIAPIRCGIP